MLQQSQSDTATTSLAESLLAPRRKITGISAVLLPFSDNQATIDWNSFERLLARTFDAGLFPAVNMDTGFGPLLDSADKKRVLQMTSDVADKRFFASGAFVADRPGDDFALDCYRDAMVQIQSFGGTPVIFQSHGLKGNDGVVVQRFAQIAGECDQFIAFELGDMFADFGEIYSLEVFREIMAIENCIGAKHSSLDRVKEWQRLALRNEVRPDFKVYTGNDLAIDMVAYGSDYLLGLSAFAPDLFRVRDDYWLAGDDRFYELNDTLQYLGAFSFRGPTPAYKHDAAMFLKLRGWIPASCTHPQSPPRPETDAEVLAEIMQRLSKFA